MKPILEIQQVSKKYQINHEGEYLSFREKLSSPFKNFNRKKEEFWALKDITFEVSPGESVGIIGKNGAGKSTLLKILSRITPPTEGRIITRGRIASLLEVGTGFHPELTGRENIFLNGSILGMKKSEIVEKFDAIVDFAGTEKFLDTALKHYSSGMQLRLAFSVAAFLEPEILVIDEVLAVGDAGFQKKCMGKMEDVSKSGRTILFVSHNMPAVTNLCDRSILLTEGKVECIGPSDEVAKTYLDSGSGIHSDSKKIGEIRKREGSGKLRFESIWLGNRNEPFTYMGEDVEFFTELSCHTKMAMNQIYLAITIFDHQGFKLTTFDNLYTEQIVYAGGDIVRISCKVPQMNLVPGTYRIDLWCADKYETFDLVEEVFFFTVEPSDVFGTGKIHSQAKHGSIRLPNFWSNAD